jgi:hypothetical protein
MPIFDEVTNTVFIPRIIVMVPRLKYLPPPGLLSGPTRSPLGRWATCYAWS